MAEPLLCPGCGERGGVRMVLGRPNPTARKATGRDDADGSGCSPQSPPRPLADTACRACGAQWSSQAKPSR